MGWVERKLDYAGGRLEGSVEHAAEKLSGVIEQGIDKAGAELRDVLREGSREIDTKLDKISQELSTSDRLPKTMCVSWWIMPPTVSAACWMPGADRQGRVCGAGGKKKSNT